MKIISKKSIFILLLLVICLGGFVLNGTYAKFTSSYTTDDNIVSYRYVFDLDIENIDEYELITVSANSDYIFNIDITNSLDSNINYGVWYGMVSPSSEENIIVAKLSNSANPTSDKIDSGETKTVSLIIKNETSSSIQVKVGVTNLSGKKIITKELENGNSVQLLNSIDVGSYVTLNYNDTDTNFRVAYVEDNVPYLISSGIVTTVCTNNDGSYNTGVDGSCDDYGIDASAEQHYNNINIVIGELYTMSAGDISQFLYSGSQSDTWNVTLSDFEKITSATSDSCINSSSSSYCGKGNDLIDIGTNYWFYDLIDDEDYGGSKNVWWNGTGSYVESFNIVEIMYYELYGVRPMLKMRSDIVITGGSGTSDDPYFISLP